MRRFTKTAHCRSGVHCRTCRDREGGRRWRRSIAAHFEVPGGIADFPCPRGRPWGWRPPDRGLGDTVERVLSAMGVGPAYKRLHRRLTGRPCGCAKRRDKLNRLMPYPRDD